MTRKIWKRKELYTQLIANNEEEEFIPRYILRGFEHLVRSERDHVVDLETLKTRRVELLDTPDVEDSYIIEGIVGIPTTNQSRWYARCLTMPMIDGFVFRIPADQQIFSYDTNFGESCRELMADITSPKDVSL